MCSKRKDAILEDWRCSTKRERSKPWRALGRDNEPCSAGGTESRGHGDWGSAGSAGIVGRVLDRPIVKMRPVQQLSDRRVRVFVRGFR